jgi:hypothetical protein
MTAAAYREELEHVHGCSTHEISKCKNADGLKTLLKLKRAEAELCSLKDTLKVDEDDAIEEVEDD